MAARVSIQTADFNLATEIEVLRAQDKRVGAVCSFIGTVRDRNIAPTLVTACTALPPGGAELARGGPSLRSASPTLVTAGTTLPPAPGDALSAETVLSMELEHYPGMTEKSIEAMIDEAHRRFDIYAVRVIHRVGLLQPLDQIVMVAVTSAHRGESFQACEFLMDYLKTQAPFWKKEQTPEGARWVDARVSDDATLARWGIQTANS